MASSSSASGTGTAVDVGESSAVGDEGPTVVILKSVKWDPFSSPDWDNEKHTREALVRIKRFEPDSIAKDTVVSEPSWSDVIGISGGC